MSEDERKKTRSLDQFREIKEEREAAALKKLSVDQAFERFFEPRVPKSTEGMQPVEMMYIKDGFYNHQMYETVPKIRSHALDALKSGGWQFAVELKPHGKYLGSENSYIQYGKTHNSETANHVLPAPYYVDNTYNGRNSGYQELNRAFASEDQRSAYRSFLDMQSSGVPVIFYDTDGTIRLNATQKVGAALNNYNQATTDSERSVFMDELNASLSTHPDTRYSDLVKNNNVQDIINPEHALFKESRNAFLEHRVSTDVNSAKFLVNEMLSHAKPGEPLRTAVMLGSAHLLGPDNLNEHVKKELERRADEFAAKGIDVSNFTQSSSRFGVANNVEFTPGYSGELSEDGYLRTDGKIGYNARAQHIDGSSQTMALPAKPNDWNNIPERSIFTPENELTFLKDNAGAGGFHNNSASQSAAKAFHSYMDSISNNKIMDFVSASGTNSMLRVSRNDNAHVVFSVPESYGADRVHAMADALNKKHGEGFATYQHDKKSPVTGFPTHDIVMNKGDFNRIYPEVSEHYRQNPAIKSNEIANNNERIHSSLSTAMDNTRAERITELQREVAERHHLREGLKEMRPQENIPENLTQNPAPTLDGVARASSIAEGGPAARAEAKIDRSIATNNISRPVPTPSNVAESSKHPDAVIAFKGPAGTVGVDANGEPVSYKPNNVANPNVASNKPSTSQEIPKDGQTANNPHNPTQSAPAPQPSLPSTKPQQPRPGPDPHWPPPPGWRPGAPSGGFNFSQTDSAKIDGIAKSMNISPVMEDGKPPMGAAPPNTPADPSINKSGPALPA